MTQAPVDPALLRRALGSFVTGVTVVTTRTASGEPTGITVNSFNTVSLSPPLVLWSLSQHATCFEAFVQSSHFVVNVLAAQQIAISERFATKGGDKFAGVAWSKTIADMPLLDGIAASYTCRNTHRYPGGDHLIFVGEVVAFEQWPRAQLVYANGGYTELRENSTVGRAAAEARNKVASS